jgi:hypothetical protein
MLSRSRIFPTPPFFDLDIWVENFFENTQKFYDGGARSLRTLFVLICYLVGLIFVRIWCQRPIYQCVCKVYNNLSSVFSAIIDRRSLKVCFGMLHVYGMQRLEILTHSLFWHATCIWYAETWHFNTLFVLACYMVGFSYVRIQCRRVYRRSVCRAY